MHDVTVLDDILFAFQTELAGFLGAAFSVATDIIVISNGFGPDEALLKVGVNDAGSRRSFCAARDGPGARLFWADSEVGDKVGGTDSAWSPGLMAVKMIISTGKK